MPTFDVITDFFIKRLLIPNVFRIDIPGYIITRSYNLGGQNVSVRTTMVPEQFLYNLETAVEKELGVKGLQNIYNAGKITGFYFSKLARFPKNESTYSVLIPSFFGTLYADKIDLRTQKRNGRVKAIDLNVKKPAASDARRFSVWVRGAIAGLCSYILDDLNVECVVKDGKNGTFSVVNATPMILNDEDIGTTWTYNNEIENFDISEYYLINKPPKESAGNRATIKKYIDEKIFKYSAGRLNLSNNNSRYLAIESSGILQLELTLPYEVVFDSSYQYFYELGDQFKELKDPLLFLSQFFTSLGFGIVDVVRSKKTTTIIFKGYPWFSKDSLMTKTPFISGAFSGFLSSQLNKKITSAFLSSGLSNDVFLVSLTLKGLT